MQRLEIGQQSPLIRVDAGKRWNPSNIQVSAGERYRVMASDHEWFDAGLEATAAGWDGNWLLKAFKPLIRCREGRWFQLIGALGTSERPLFPLGIDAEWVIPAGEDVELTLFANDVIGMYWNNRGFVEVTVTRLA